MDVSIVSGTYNRLDYLQRMVASVCQSMTSIYGLEYEIVLVDGGSTDGTIEWCKSQPDIRLIEHGALHGAVKAFNDGAYAATGKYVIMANDDIEFVGDSIAHAYVYMETHPLCGGGCFWQDRDGRDWHVNGMQAVKLENGKPTRVHVYYAQVGIFPKWLGDKVGWWCNELEYGQVLKKDDFRRIKDGLIGLHTYGGDNELSAQIIDLGFTVEPITPTQPFAKISDKEAQDGLRERNNVEGANDPKAVRGGHPDSHKFGQKWIRRNEILGYYGHYPGPILKDKPQIEIPMQETKERVLYLPLFEQGWQVLEEQKRGLRDALARIALIREYNYMKRVAQIGKDKMMSEIYQVCNQFRPTIVLTQLHNGDIINAGDIGNLRRACGNTTQFVNWNGDYWPDQLLDQKGLELVRSFDLMTTVNREVQEKHQQKGINTQYWQIGWEPLGRGHEPEVFHDVVFLASGYSTKRQQLGRFLHKQGWFELGLYGHGWAEGMSKGECLYNFIEACKIYRGAKIAIGDSQWPNSGFVSNRIFQILAAGGCVLCHQWFRGIEQLGLQDGVNCVIWENMADLGQKLNYWLSDSRSQELRRIALEGEKLALEKHSFDSRVEELWEMLGIGMEKVEMWDWR